MKPLTNWPRKGSVLSEIKWDDMPGFGRWQSIEQFTELFYRVNQDYMTWEYRHGKPNAGLSPDVVQMIQWMSGTRMFTGVEIGRAHV